MSNYSCHQCKKGLISDEIALHRKLYGLAANKYLCLDCQADYLDSSREKLEAVIEMYHRRGNCVLFAKWDS